MMGKCEYCGKRISKRTKFCAECVREWNRVTDKYMDGDPFMPLRVAAEYMKEHYKEPLTTKRRKHA